MTATQDSVTQLGNLFVVPNQCKFAADRSSAIIVIQSKSTKGATPIEELQDRSVRDLALNYAASQGVPDPRVNGNVDGPYPINDDGTPLDLVKSATGEPLPPTHIKMQPAAYRANVPVTRKLV